MLMDKLENRSSAVAELDPDDVHRAIADGALLIDGRTPEAYDAYHVPGSVNVPVAGEASSPLAARAAVGRELSVDRRRRDPTSSRSTLALDA